MRKSTLLLGLLVAGSAAAADYIVPEVTTADAPKYYKVVSNRALTLQYAGAYGPEGEVLAAANTPVAAGEGTYGTRPYIGLYNLDYAAISWDTDTVPDASLLWRFEAAEGNTAKTLDGGVYWINLFSPKMKLNAKGNGQGDYARLSASGSPIYVFNLNAYNGDGEYAFLENTYSINSKNDVFASAGFDTKNFVARNQRTEAVLSHPYSFIGADWQPFSDFGYNQAAKTFTSDPNLNNGSAFYFEAATDEEVAAAKVALVELEKKILEEQGPALIAEAIANYADATVGFANVPVLWTAADVAATKAKIEALPLSMDGLKSLDELYTAIEEYNDKCEAIIAELTVKAAGKNVHFVNVARAYNGIEGEPYYLGFGDVVTFDEETGEEIHVLNLMGVDQANSASTWTLIAANGGLKLKNLEYAAYPIDTISAINRDWGFTFNPDSAAIMQIMGVNTTDEDVLAELTEIENVVGIGFAGYTNSEAAWMHAAGSGTNYNVVRWMRDNLNGPSCWRVSLAGEGGIETVATDNVEAAKAIYDLSGRQINAITRSGLYIINGKKVIVKK